MRLGCQTLAAALLDVVDIEILGRATIEADLDGFAEGIHLGGAELFAFLHQAQACLQIMDKWDSIDVPIYELIQRLKTHKPQPRRLVCGVGTIPR
jgi:hypothetical protein